VGVAFGDELQPDHRQQRDHRRDRHQLEPAAGEHPGDVGPEEVEVGRAEEDPGEDDEVERDEPAQPARHPLDPAPERVLGREAGAVEAAPEHEGPGGAVPEPT